MCLFVGIDWGSQAHSVCVVDAQGRRLDRFEVSHSADGLSSLSRRLRRHESPGQISVAIERPNGLIVDTLLHEGFTLVPVQPNAVAGYRSRYSTAGAKNDPADAYLLADVLRTDGHRLRQLKPSSDQLKALRAQVHVRDDLVHQRVRSENQLRSLLESFWPGPLGLFSEFSSLISLAFLEHFPSPQAAAGLTERRLTAFLKRQSYNGGQKPGDLLAKLRAAAPGRCGAQEARIKGELVQSQVRILQRLVAELSLLTKQIEGALEQMDDGLWLRSFPCIGKINAAQILVELGDDRERFANSEELSAVAGVSPVPDSSGQPKHRQTKRGKKKPLPVKFRYACNHRLRNALTHWADSSRHQSPWATQLYEKATKEKGYSHAHAIRILARAWARVLFRCWKDRTPYDEERHLQAVRKQQVTRHGGPKATSRRKG
jgi:transposase